MYNEKKLKELTEKMRKHNERYSFPTKPKKEKNNKQNEKKLTTK